MKIVLAGSRRMPTMHLHEPQDWFREGIQEAMLDLLGEIIKKSQFEITEIVSGSAWGIDSLGEKYAEINQIPLKKFPAKWKELGKKAGPIRNFEMAKYGDGLILVMSEHSSGSENMLECIKRENKPYYVVIIGDNPTEKWTK